MLVLRSAVTKVAPVLSLIASVGAANATGVDWFRFLGPNLDGKSPEQGIRRDWQTEAPPTVWSRPIGEGYSAPTLADNRLFVFDRHADRARLSALDPKTGREIWRSEYSTQYVDMYGYSGGPRASPVVDGNRVFAYGVDGLLRAHDVESGRVLWEVDTTRRFDVVQNFFGVGSTPLVHDDLLIVMVGGSPPDSPPIHSQKVVGNGSGIVGFDKVTGEVRYQSSDELASYSSPVVHRIGDQARAFAFMRGGLIAFDPQTGDLHGRFPWRSRKLESVNAATPILVGDAVLITESYGPGAAVLRPKEDGLDVVRTDDPRSRDKSLAAHWATPIYRGGYVYGSSGESSGNSDLRCIDPWSGEVLWSKKLPRSTLLYADEHLIVLTERGRLLLVVAIPDRYEPVGEIDLGDRLGYPSWNAPVLSHGLLYVRGSKSLIALELIPSTGRAPRS